MTQSLTRILRQSQNTVFFGGAGVSTESGIPDFRSETGIFAAMEHFGQPPEVLLSGSFLAQAPETFFAYYKKNLIYREAKPNAAHRALAALEAKGQLSAVITQNIDGLHQAAGSRRVYELHGATRRNYCTACGKRHSLDDIFAWGESEVPRCTDCGGLVRPDVVLYGEPLDDGVWQAARQAVEEAQVLLVGGTSLAVYPAAGLLQYFRGDHLCLINKTPTPYDDRADVVIHDAIGKVLGETVSRLEEALP